MFYGEMIRMAMEMDSIKRIGKFLFIQAYLSALYMNTVQGITG